MISFSNILSITLLATLIKTVVSSPVPFKNQNDLQILKRSYNTDDSVLRGVNIGGWLVLEPYITPSLFEAFRTNDYNDDGIPVDEYHYCEQLGHNEAQRRLIEHWDSFYTEQDFADIASKGFNMVRIPVGYWAFQTLPNDPYITNLQEHYLDKAISWARNNGLKVWVDLHGAAGSQNGFDNSGLRDSINFLDDDNLAVTMTVIKHILKKYSGDEYSDTVIGIELINEPLGPSIDLDKLKYNYLQPCYDYLRNEVGSDMDIIVHDAFEAYNSWDSFLSYGSGASNVAIDHHHYQVFSPDQLATDMNSKIAIACDWGRGVLSEGHWTVAGEFSAALTDCTKWLNGVGVGARYDGSFLKNGPDGSYWIGSCENNEDINSWSDERKANTRKYIEAQLDAFEMRGGWIIWCYKTETSIEWGVDKLIEYGLFPQPLSDRQYPGQCN